MPRSKWPSIEGAVRRALGSLRRSPEQASRDYLRKAGRIRRVSRNGFSYAFVSFDEGSWHPLTWLSHMAMCEFAGLNPGPHHTANVVLHLINTVLLLFLMLQLLYH